jgi:hypothetical protein
MYWRSNAGLVVGQLAVLPDFAGKGNKGLRSDCLASLDTAFRINSALGCIICISVFGHAQKVLKPLSSGL